jgi:hypothetical protein
MDHGNRRSVEAQTELRRLLLADASNSDDLILSLISRADMHRQNGGVNPERSTRLFPFSRLSPLPVICSRASS